MASIGFWGALAGVSVSVAIGLTVNRIATNSFLKDFQGFDLFAFPPLAFAGLIAGITFLACLAGALPALKASRLDPIKALRYE
jgi:putative ABC transport system permease protein